MYYEYNNEYCTHIGNEYFAWFESTNSKSRINFLKLLRVENEDLIINIDALEYMSANRLPQYQIDKLAAFKDEKFSSDATWTGLLNSIGISHQKSCTYCCGRRSCWKYNPPRF